MNSTTSMTMAANITAEMPETTVNMEIKTTFISKTESMEADMDMVAVADLLLMMVLLPEDTMDISMPQASETDTMKKSTTILTMTQNHTIMILFTAIAAPPAVRASRVSPPSSTQSSSTLITILNQENNQTMKPLPPIQLTTEKDRPVLELT